MLLLFQKDCPDGKLDQKMFRKSYRKFFPSSDPEIFSEHVFRVFDDDSNGFIGKNKNKKIVNF